MPKDYLYILRSLIGVVTILVFSTVPANLTFAQNGQSTTEALALYQGPDRDQKLIEGAKKEGQLTFYNSHTWMATVAREFEKKYPYIKVSDWRSGSAKLFKRVTEEQAAGRHFADVIDTTFPIIKMLHDKDILQQFFTPGARQIDDDLVVRGEKGIYYLATWEIYLGLGYNTKRISAQEAPKTYLDLLDPKWKGKMTISRNITSTRWVGVLVNTLGMDYFQKLKQQDLKLQALSGAAIANLIVSGEVLLSPTIYDSNIKLAQSKNAPVDWRPLEPVQTLLGYSALARHAPHPHAALLLLDYLHSKEGQKVITQGRLNSPRKDVGSLEQQFEKIYIESIYPDFEQYKQHYRQWERLLKELP